MKVTGPDLLKAWNVLTSAPWGRRVFSALVGLAVPYSGSIRAQVERLSPGYAAVRLKDCRRVRNHLGSIHAIALANLGELTSGLALITSQPSTVRSILVGLNVSYLKKARGTLRAECTVSPLTITTSQIVEVLSCIRNGAGEAVAEVRATWKCGPV